MQPIVAHDPLRKDNPKAGLRPGPRPSLGDQRKAVTGRAPLARAPGRLPENPRPGQGQAASRSPTASLDPAGEPRAGTSLPDRGDPASHACGANPKIARAIHGPVTRSADGHERARAVTTTLPATWRSRHL